MVDVYIRRLRRKVDDPYEVKLIETISRSRLSFARSGALTAMKLLKTIWNWLIDFLHSIRFRITLWFVFILAVVLTAFSGFIYFRQSRDLQEDFVGSIQEKFARILGYFRSAEWQNSNLGLSDVPDNAPPLQQGDMLVIVDTNAQIVQTWGIKPTNKLVSDLVSTASQQRNLNVYEQTLSVTDLAARHLALIIFSSYLQ